MSSQFNLLTQRRFLPLFVTQFLGAMNDNLFKFGFTLLVAYGLLASPIAILGDRHILANLIGAIFICPFLLFSGIAGELADKYEKSFLMQLVKVLEVGIMLLGAAGFILANPVYLLMATFLLGTHSTFFGPLKYSYLPQHLNQFELTGGNGLIEMGTFVAILIGTILAGSLVAQPAPAWPLSIITMLLAIMGLACALFIPKTPAISPALTLNFNPFAATLANLRLARQSRPIFLSLLGISWLWMFGAIFLTQFGSFARDVLNAPPAIATALLVIFSLGIAIGSLLCERLSSGKIEIGLVPFGSIGMTIFSFDMCLAATAPTLKAQFSNHATFLSLFSSWASIRLAGDLFFCALFSGFYSVPLYAFIQQRALNKERSRIIAANNILNAFFMIGSAILSIVVLTVFKASLVTLFFVVSFLNACVAIYIYCLVPEFLLRFVAWCLAHTMYRIKKVNIEALPQEGAAVIVSNHVSFVDAVIIMGMSPRPLRFVMDHKIFAVPFLSWFFRTARAIPIASAKDRVDLLNAAYDEISVALKNNELVCIFPEGRITDTGELYPFKRGIERILARDNVPVIPLALQGLWGSFFSRAHGGKAFNGWRGFFNKIGVNIGDSIKFECHENKESEKIDIPELLQEKIKILRGDWK